MKIKSPLIFIGTSGGGKTTLLDKLAKEYDLRIVDIYKYVEPYLDKHGRLKVQEDLLKKPYQDLILDLPNLNFNILEIASDWPDEFLPQIIEKLKTKPILIFCDTSLKTSVERNRKRNRNVPEDTLKTQSRFDYDFYKNLTSKIGIELVVINNEKSVTDSYQNLKNKLKL